MTVIQSTFNRAGDLYGRWFADWLHVHFIIRTVILLFVLWLIIFLAAQLLRYLIAPMVLFVYYHIIFRAWNYVFVETPHEWIYIRYHSKDLPNFSALYLRLCDKVKRNRLILSHTKFKGLTMRSRRFSAQVMIISAVAVTLWVSAFGLHHEYAVPAMVEVTTPEINTMEEPSTENGQESVQETPVTDEPPPQYYEEVHYYPTAPENQITPADWQENAILTLNEQGKQGARLRDGPGITGQTIIEILWDDVQLTYLNMYVPDLYVSGLFWLRVQSPGGAVGYISSQLVCRSTV